MTRDPSLTDFMACLEGRRAEEAQVLDEIYHRVTGFHGRVHGGRIIGYGRYDYTYESGHSGSSFATGFAPAKARIAFHILPGYKDFEDILARIGKHKMSVSCLYVNKLADIDLTVLEELIAAGLDNLRSHWPVLPE